MKRPLTRLFTVALMCLLCTGVQAQDTYFTIKPQSSLDHDDVSLDGKCAVTFLSRSNSLVVTSSNVQDQVQSPVQRPDGQWAYQVLCDPKQGPDRKFTVYQQGTAMKDEKKILVSSCRSVYLSVEMFERQIHLNNQTTTAMYPEDGRACIEVSTPLEDMQVRVSERLNPEIKRSKGASGTHIISIIIDTNALTALRTTAESSAAAAKAQTEKLNGMEGEIDDAEFDKEDLLNAKAAEAGTAYAEALSLSLYAEGTNEVAVPADDVAGLNAKAKLLFGVIELNRTVTVGTTELAQTLVTANRAVEQRKYNEAMRLYRQAAESDEASEAERAGYAAYAQSLEEYAELKSEANKSFALLKSLKDGKTEVSYNTVESCYLTIIHNYGVLYDKTNDAYYQRTVQGIQEKYDALPLIVEGETKTSNFKQGRLIVEARGRVKIYGINASLSGSVKSSRAHSLAQDGHLLGSSDAAGKFKVEITPRQAYRALLFVDESLGGQALAIDGSSNMSALIRFTKD